MILRALHRSICSCNLSLTVQCKYAKSRLAELEEFAACIRNEAFVGIPRNEQQRVRETFKLMKANLAAACDAAIGKQKKLRSAA